MSGRGRGRGRGRAPTSGARLLLQRSAKEAGLDERNLRNLQDITKPRLFPDYEWHSSGRRGHNLPGEPIVPPSVSSGAGDPSREPTAVATPRRSTKTIHLINKSREIHDRFQNSAFYVQLTQEADVIRHGKERQQQQQRADLLVLKQMSKTADPQYVPPELLRDDDLDNVYGSDDDTFRKRSLDDLAAEERAERRRRREDDGDDDGQFSDAGADPADDEDEEDVDYATNHYESENEESAVTLDNIMENPARKRHTNGRNARSRSPFRTLRASPWIRGNGMSGKMLNDNTRGLVEAAKSNPKKMVVKRKEPLPFRTPHPVSNGSGVSPWRHHTKGTQEEPKTELHESEISIFKQLCLDKHDENAAIEILLDSTTESSIPELYTASSESTDHGSGTPSRKKAGSVDGKKKFLDRLFFKSSRKSSSQSDSSAASDFVDASKENNLSWSHSSNLSDEQSTPTPPSSIPRTRISVETVSASPAKVSWTGPPVRIPSAKVKVDKTRSILDDTREVGDTVSNISSLSGTRASSLVTPVTLDRHESLGFESIRDIRKCLLEVERQLGKASQKGQRVSRQKVMRALFTVADSLEDDEEKDYLQKELNTAMKVERDPKVQPVAPVDKAKKADSSDDEKSELTSSDDEDEFTLDSNTFEDGDRGEDDDEPAFNIVSSVGNFFGVSTRDQQTVEEVLDDLLWTEFVSSRQKNEKSKSMNGGHSPPIMSRKGRKKKSNKQEHGTSQNHGSRNQSWWRNRHSEEDDDYSSSSSEVEVPSYLPTSITVKQRYKKPKSFESTVSRSTTSNPRYKVKLVDTESRMGYEMDNAPRRSPVL
ncbi:unnamed protein product [Pseudo-nitzschia multistriata]|uniref:Uncharacterized protein n=1 Tax=Pseudo-nitzschia multistriata TaxID=183589 RepID=A0A448YW05_9STRA|nr:unnamed protein product [Pseudo-nitzschia multistriata]